MPKILILQQLQHLKELVVASFSGEEVLALSLEQYIALLLERGDVHQITDSEQQQLLVMVRRLFPEWTIERAEKAPPQRVDIAYVLRTLDVSRSAFYRSIDEKLLKRLGKIGGKPVYRKSDVDELLLQAKEKGGGGWVYSKLGKGK